MHLCLLTNGHGEEAAGAAIARSLTAQRPGLILDAAPLASSGGLFAAIDARVVAQAPAPWSGGFPFASPTAFFRDVPAVVPWVGYARRPDSGDPR